jgi:DNA-binding MarR family transcriptional regulator
LQKFLHSARELRDLSVVDLLHRASQSADVAFVRHTGDKRLNARQYAVLRAVAQGEGLSQQGIVEATGIDRSTLASMVQRLVRRGLLQRRRTKHDARAYAVRLTSAGKEALAKMGPGAQNADAHLMGAIQAGRRAQLRSALVELIASTQRD